MADEKLSALTALAGIDVAPTDQLLITDTSGTASKSITIADLGDVFTIPGNIEKTFDQISKAVGHVYASGAFPVVLGGDHSIGFPTTRAVAEHLKGGKLGIIHFDRHVDTQETDLDERMHTTPWFVTGQVLGVAR